MIFIESQLLKYILDLYTYLFMAMVTTDSMGILNISIGYGHVLISKQNAQYYYVVKYILH